MQFCPKCGGIIIEKKNKSGCTKCRYSIKGKVKIESTEEVTEKQKPIEVKKKDTNVMPVVFEVCPKCGYKEAYFWTSQTRSADESETKFFKCVKCKNTWREYR
jgi:DNA-directed RNA polymerase subunit M